MKDLVIIIIAGGLYLIALNCIARHVNRTTRKMQEEHRRQSVFYRNKSESNK
jgi:hypothetical protein